MTHLGRRVIAPPLFTLIICFLLIGLVLTNDVFPSPALRIYKEIFLAIRENSFHDLSSKEVKQLRRCLIKEAESKPGPIQEKVRNCFSQDKYVFYYTVKEYKDFLLKRNDDQTGSNDVEARQLGEEVGHLIIKSFHKVGVERKEIVPALEELKKKGVNRIVLDLRGNGGGDFDSALETLRLFSPAKDRFIVELRKKGGEVVKNGRHFTSARGPYADWIVFLLVDQETSSAAEMVTGVMQLWGSKVFGTKTKGKGSVQSVVQLSDGGALFVTFAEYYLANSKTPEGEGITPDVFLEMGVEKEFHPLLKN